MAYDVPGSRLPNRPMNLREVADFLGVSERTVRNYVARGLIPASRIGPKLLRIAPNDLAAFMTKEK